MSKPTKRQHCSWSITQILSVNFTNSCILWTLFVAFLHTLLIRSCNTVRLAINQNASIHAAMIRFRAFVIYSDAIKASKKTFPPHESDKLIEKIQFCDDDNCWLPRSVNEERKGERVTTFLFAFVSQITMQMTLNSTFTSLFRAWISLVGTFFNLLCEIFSSSFHVKLPTRFDVDLLVTFTFKFLGNFPFEVRFCKILRELHVWNRTKFILFCRAELVKWKIKVFSHGNIFISSVKVNPWKNIFLL